MYRHMITEKMLFLIITERIQYTIKRDTRFSIWKKKISTDSTSHIDSFLVGEG